MNLGLRTILLLAAVILFLISVFANENAGDLLAFGLAVFAAAFLSDALGYADRTFNSTRRGTGS